MRVKDTSRIAPKIRDTSPSAKKINPEKVAELLGAELLSSSQDAPSTPTGQIASYQELAHQLKLKGRQILRVSLPKYAEQLMEDYGYHSSTKLASGELLYLIRAVDLRPIERSALEMGLPCPKIL